MTTEKPKQPPRGLDLSRGPVAPASRSATDPSRPASASATDRLLDRGRRWYAEGRFPEAERAFAEVVASGDRAADGFYGLGVTRWRRRDLDAAADSFRQAARLDPTNADALYYLGAIAERQGRADEARGWFEQTLTIDPTHPWALDRLGSLDPSDLLASMPLPGAPSPSSESESGRDPAPGQRSEDWSGPNGAMTELEATALLRQGEELFAQGHHAESEAAFGQVAAAGVRGELTGQALYRLGVVRWQLGDLDAAGMRFDEALQYDPRDANALFYLGMIGERRGRIDEARGYYGRALQLNPQHQGARDRLAQSSGVAPPAIPAVAPAGVNRPPIQPPPAASPRVTGRYGIYETLLQDDSALSKQTIGLIDALRRSVRPRFSAYLDRFLGPVLLLAIALVAVAAGNNPGAIALRLLAIGALLLVATVRLIDPTISVLATAVRVLVALFFLGWFAMLGGFIVTGARTPADLLRRVLAAAQASGLQGWVSAGPSPLLALGLGVLALAITYANVACTKVTIDRARLQIRQGFLWNRLSDVELWRVQDVDLSQTLLNRLTHDGTLVFTVYLVGSSPTTVKVTGLARAEALDDIFQDLLDLIRALRSNRWIQGIVS